MTRSQVRCIVPITHNHINFTQQGLSIRAANAAREEERKALLLHVVLFIIALGYGDVTTVPLCGPLRAHKRAYVRDVTPAHTGSSSVCGVNR